MEKMTKMNGVVIVLPGQQGDEQGGNPTPYLEMPVPDAKLGGASAPSPDE